MAFYSQHQAVNLLTLLMIVDLKDFFLNVCLLFMSSLFMSTYCFFIAVIRGYLWWIEVNDVKRVLWQKPRLIKSTCNGLG